MEALKQIDVKDLAARAAWTFLQAFLAVFLLAGESIVDLLFRGDWEQLYVVVLAATVAGIAAGLSALKTLTLHFIAVYREGVL